MTVRIITGDALTELAKMPAESVHCCVTSPPYFGLRDYGTALWDGGDPACDHTGPPMRTNNKPSGTGSFHGGTSWAFEPMGEVCKCGARRVDRQLGLEATPDEYVAAMVWVFREVRRVLRSDGTLFLNIGDSYASSSTYNAPRSMHSDAGWKQPGRGPNARAYGNGGKGKSGSRQHGSTSIRFCGACRADLLAGRSLRNDRSRAVAPAPLPFVSSRGHRASVPDRPATSGLPGQIDHNEAAILDLRLDVHREAVPPRASQVSSLAGSSRPLPAACSPGETPAGECQSCAGPLLDYVPLSVHTSDAETETSHCTSGNASPSEAPSRRSQRTEASGSTLSAYGYSTTAYLKPKDLIGIPWLLAFALRADGWWLRQDIIWSKPNPMPESVTDRCTKTHEYVFMLSKSERYFYDGDAVREPYGEASLGRYEYQFQASTSPGRRQPNNTDERYKQRRDGTPNAAGRNKRSVWTVATASFPSAHFATFPPALVEPCIMAGCPNGGIVLDPFLGAGTTALVADRLGRSAIGIELSPSYAAMARRRIEDDAGMFAQLEAAE